MNLFSSFNPPRGRGLAIVFLTILLAMLTVASRAIADDINPDADIPDASTLDSTPANPVLELPQQCDEDSVAMLCKSSSDATSTADATSGPDSGVSSFASAYPASADGSSANAYGNQNVAHDA